MISRLSSYREFEIQRLEQETKAKFKDTLNNAKILHNFCKVLMPIMKTIEGKR